ncbi:MAG: 3-hydroxybutyryl-CoA dehydrogenase [Anaerolineales bacterium]|nr:MAG: 3-hydroxybutyryl-CoA dehydrogenase [Anaerolineales bacterium]
MTIRKIFVVGAGTMGNGIAQTAAVSGYEVTMMDVVEEALDRAQKTIEKSVNKLYEKERITEEQKKAALNIATTSSMEDIAKTDFAIEAATENLDLKLKIFTEIDKLAKPGVILASNTSSISLTKIASATKQPEKVIGMHFFNPVALMKLVEVVRGKQTSDETMETVVWLAEKMGKTPVVVNDSPGFVSNRILCPMINEAIYTLEEGVSTKEGIDTVINLGLGHPMGPLTLADLIGLDVVLSILEILHQDLNDDKYHPAPLLRQMVEAGDLGKKTGKGFYEYN